MLLKSEAYHQGHKGHWNTAEPVRLKSLQTITLINHEVQCSFQYTTKEKGKAIPVTGRGGPYGCDTSRLPVFYTVSSQMAVRLSALRVGRPLPPPPPRPRKIPGTHYC
jgi:hypothetical protein